MSDAADRVRRRFEALPTLVAQDADLVRRGRFLTCDVCLGVGDQQLLLRIVDGRVLAVHRGPFLLRPWTFSIHASAEDWLGFLEPVPKPGWHDLMAMSKRGSARIEGDLQPFMANLQFIKDVLATPRRQSHAEASR